MGKISRTAGATHAVPQPLVDNLLRMQEGGATLTEMRDQLNAWATPHADPGGNSLPGSWTLETTKAILDAPAAS
ncbi:hypothetical protein AB0F77_20910 [Streptomyces sp. NPDC026672]|uniref:hypothetical protein n=1 Tax=unclassified Streptomyces TaxID=2593676 RepID=UPI0033D3FD63